jgi:hypothetical protein
MPMLRGLPIFANQAALRIGIGMRDEHINLPDRRKVPPGSQIAMLLRTSVGSSFPEMANPLVIHEASGVLSADTSGGRAYHHQLRLNLSPEDVMREGCDP